MIKFRTAARSSVIAFTVVFSMVLSSFLTGCEEGGGTRALTVSPSYINLTASTTNTTQTFTVSDGLRDLSLPLEWSVSNPDLGRIGASGGNSASYVAYTGKSGDNTVYVKDQYDAEGVATVRQ